jgi:hypothetical protein
MIINHNCCVKLVPLVIFIYDARSHIHQHIEYRVYVLCLCGLYLLLIHMLSPFSISGNQIGEISKLSRLMIYQNKVTCLCRFFLYPVNSVRFEP